MQGAYGSSYGFRERRCRACTKRLEGSLNGEKAIVYYFEARRICQQAQRSDRDECVRSSMSYLLFAFQEAVHEAVGASFKRASR
jgi:hypothetical protein